MTSQAALLVSQLSQGWCWAVSEATAVTRPSMTEADQMDQGATDTSRGQGSGGEMWARLGTKRPTDLTFWLLLSDSGAGLAVGGV